MFLQYELPKRLAKAVDIQKRLACASTEELLEKRRQMNEKIIFRSSGMRLLISAGWM